MPVEDLKGFVVEKRAVVFWWLVIARRVGLLGAAITKIIAFVIFINASVKLNNTFLIFSYFKALQWRMACSFE